MCPALTDDRFCPAHAQQDSREYNHYRRDPESDKRYGSEWRKIRARYIAANPLCEACLREGRLRPAEHVHHIVPLRGSNDNSESNLMSLCQHHHSSIHMAELNRRRE